MTWTKPDFVEIPLGMEVTAYANTDTSQAVKDQGPPQSKDNAQSRGAREGGSSLNPQG